MSADPRPDDDFRVPLTPDADPDPAVQDPSAADSETRAPGVSEVLGAALGQAARRAGIDPSAEQGAGRMVWAAVGGVRGILESVLPSLAFIVAFTLSSQLLLSLAISVGIGLVFSIVRLVAKQPPSAALGGLVAALVAAALALFTGNPSDNFVPGLVTNALYGGALLISALVGWPVIGLAVGYLMGEGTAWRRDRRRRRIFFWLTIAWAALFAARLAVQLPIYLSSLGSADPQSAVALLGTLKLVMGLPLFAPLLAVTWLVCRSVYARSQAEDVS